MRILHLVSYSLFSGPVPPTLALALAQQRAGHTVWLAIDRRRGATNAYEEAAAPHLDATSLIPAAPLTLSTKASPMQLWRDMRTLRALCTDAHAPLDIVHVHMSHDHALATLCHAPTVIRTVHAPRSLNPRLGQRWLMRRAHGWIVRCTAHEQALGRTFAVPQERIGRIVGAVDTQRFAPADAATRAAARRQWGVPEQALLLGHVALMAGRGQEELIEAVYRLGPRAPHLLLVGRGEHEAALRQRVQALRLTQTVHFSGYASGPALQQAYAALDGAFVAQAGNDASTRAALEALACGLPVIARQEAALGEAVTDATGYPFTTRRVEEVMDAVLRWAQDPAEGQRRGEAGRRAMLQERQVDQEAAATLAFYAACKR